MRYIPVTCEQREAMLRKVGVDSVADLFVDVPREALIGKPLDLPAPMSEITLAGHVRSLSAQNTPATSLVSFMGAGCYDHYIPSVVDHVVSKPEFFTAYTPYQPEVSQGTLQAIYEYQTMVCELTGMDVANASMYDGATAFVEAALMACRAAKRGKIVVAGSIHPEWLEVMETYTASGLFEMAIIDFEHGRLDPAVVSAALDSECAALMVASPNFVGAIEELGPLGEAAREVGALFVVASNPIILGVMEPPGNYGADIVVGEGQPLGNAMSYGGPGLGFFACREKHVRQIPGRLVGRTVDADGNTAFVLTLSTREQHIRREKATSNICSNHALNALTAGVYLSAVGREGLAGIARASIAKAHYLHDRLIATGRFFSPWDVPFANEFTLAYQGDAAAMHAAMLDKGILAGLILDTAEEAGVDLVLLAVTEKRTRAEIDRFVAEVAML